MGINSLKVWQLVVLVIGVLLLAVLTTIAGSTIGFRILGYGDGGQEEGSRRLTVGETRHTGPLYVRAYEPEAADADVGVPTEPSWQLAEIPDQFTVGIAYQTISRFTGPFAPAEFQEIQVLLNANSGTWYYNDFFGSVDAGIYRKYYSAVLGDPSNPAHAARFPPTPPPENTAFPGTNPQRPGASTGPPPGTNGAPGILFTLKRVEYSSRYGGSLKLVFAMEEEYAYEFRFDRYLYDMPELEMSVYVVPTAYLLNPTPIPPPQTRSLLGALAVAISVEFSLPEDYESYEWVCENAAGELVSPENSCPANGTALGISPVPAHGQTVARTHLAENLLAYAGVLAGNMQLHASCFAYGFLHSLHAATLSSEAVRPDRVAISDDNFELVTHAGEPIFSIMYRVTDFDTWSGVIWAKPEIVGKVVSVTEIEGSDFVLEREVHSFVTKTGTIEVEDGDDDTYWATAASFSYWDVQSYVQDLRNLDSGVGPDDVVTVWYQIPYEVKVDMKWHTLLSTTSSGYALWSPYWPFYEFAEEFRVLSDQAELGSLQQVVENGRAGVQYEKSYQMWDKVPPEHQLQMTLLFRVTLAFR